MHILFVAGVFASFIYLVLVFTEYEDSFFGGLCLGVMSGMMIVGVLITSRSAIKIQKGKQMFLDKVFHHR